MCESSVNIYHSRIGLHVHFEEQVFSFGASEKKERSASQRVLNAFVSLILVVPPIARYCYIGVVINQQSRRPLRGRENIK